MTLYAANFIEHIESFQGREFESLGRVEKFKFLFLDTTKLRIRLPNRDVSVPLSVLLLGINQLLARKKFSKEICERLIGKYWGYSLIARMLLECEDVALDPDGRGMALIRIPKNSKVKEQIAPPDKQTVAVNPNGNGKTNKEIHSKPQA